MGRSMGGGGSRGSGGSRSSGSRSSGSRGSSGGSRSMGTGRRGTSRAFGSGHSGGSSARGTGRSYSGQTSSGNPMMGGGSRPQGGHYGGHHGGYHNPPPPRRHYYGYGRRRYYYDGPNRVYVNNYSGSSSGCSSIFAGLILLIIVFSALGSMRSYRNTYDGYYNNKAPSYSDSYSNIEREKFTGKVNVNGFFSDPDGLLYDDEYSILENGLRHFYNTTGVCAYVYLVEELDPGVDGVDEASALYDELFDDEGHILLLYDYHNAYMYDACGYEIAGTIDNEAVDILYDYIEAQWSRDSENLGAIFGGGCAMAADRIMHREKTFAEKYKGIIIALIVGIVVIVVVSILFKWWKKRTAQKNKEQEDLERTLNTPLETFGDSMADLQQKYDDTSGNP